MIKNSLQHIHDQFVVAPIDRDNGHVAFICKHFYIELLIKKIGIDPNVVSNYSGTHNMLDIDDQLIINEHSESLQKYFKFKVSHDNKVFPSIYWIPKLHKNPVKAKFIILSPRSSLKSLMKSVTSALK